MRLDKFLGHTGEGSRSFVQKLIKQKRVKVGGQVINKPEYQLVPTQVVVTVDEREVVYQAFYHFVLHKPAGYITATKDENEKTVLDLLDERDRNKMVAPVGRLDKDTEGLLILTSDGKMAHGLLSPKKHVPKKYYVEVEGEVTNQHIQSVLEGVTLGDGMVCLPAKLEIIEATKQASKVYLTIEEGKFHQVKRMMAYLGSPVTYLKRVQMGAFYLPEDLQKGEYRALTKEDLCLLKGES